MLIECSHACIPRKRAASSKKCVAGWNSECSDLRKQSIAWHHMWVQAGRPNAGVIANIMCATRKKYHLASKQVLRSQNNLRNANIANAHYTSSYDFWSEVKRANACKAKSNARVVINGSSSPPDIANAFKDVYENIFRAGFTSSDDIQRFRIELYQRCESEAFQRFTPDDVIKACLQLKSNTKDADLQLFADAIIHTPHDFFVVLCTLNNAIIFCCRDCRLMLLAHE